MTMEHELIGNGVYLVALFGGLILFAGIVNVIEWLLRVLFGRGK